MVDTSSIQAAYRDANRKRRIRESKIGASVGLVLVPMGGILDYFVYPHVFFEFLSWRLLCALAIWLILLLHYTKRGQLHIELLTFGWLITVQIMICYMIYSTDGYSSTYYAGLNLAILAYGFLLPTSIKEAMIFVMASLALYWVACEANTGGEVAVDIAFNNLFFLVLTGIISTIAVQFGINRRFAEFRLGYELDKRNKELTKLDHIKSQFFANVSHELRTPLTLILAPVQELLEGGWRLPDAVAGRLGIVRNNGMRLLKLVNDLLDVIRLEEGKSSLDKIPQDLVPLIAGLVDSMIHLADTKEVALEKELDDQPLVVMGDQPALEKIFINLINNALKFTEAGGRVRISAHRQDERAVIEVEDTGIGIDAKDLPTIFDRFHQVDGSATRRYQGTGLGLALAKELVEKQGGEVSVQSQPGVGTTLRVEFPVTGELASDSQIEPEDNDSLQQLHRSAERMAGLTVEQPPMFDEEPLLTGTSNPRVLVVDDEPDMRRYLVDMLYNDYEVIQARDGRLGLELAQRYRPNLMLLDLMLPEMDGLEVCRLLKQDQDTRGIKIMLLTARVDEQAKITALDHGADDFLTKPFSRVEVETRLRNLLHASHLERDLEQRNETLEAALTELRKTQAQLIQSEKLNAMGSLSAGLLHEVNNPLNYAITALQLVQMDPAVEEDEILKDTVADVDEGMQRIRTIVSDLRAFAYPSEMEKQLPFNFAAAVEKALRFTAGDTKEIDIERELVEDDEVLGSQTHVVQVLLNLVTNAARAIDGVKEQRRGRIRIRSEVRGQRLQIWVEDNGVGMDQETLKQVFDPFFTTRDVGEGMGMGLSICHTIIGNHGGTLEAESELGKGSRFRFDLPLAAADGVLESA